MVDSCPELVFKFFVKAVCLASLEAVGGREVGFTEVADFTALVAPDVGCGRGAALVTVTHRG